VRRGMRRRSSGSAASMPTVLWQRPQEWCHRPRRVPATTMSTTGDRSCCAIRCRARSLSCPDAFAPATGRGGCRKRRMSYATGLVSHVVQEKKRPHARMLLR